MINIEKEEKLPTDGWLKINKLTLRDKKNKTFSREFLNCKNAVCSVVYDTMKNKYIFVNLFRPGPKKEIIEIVAGLIETGENPKNTMIREIQEEIGYQVDTITEIIKPYYTSPGHTNEMMYTYFSTVSKKISQGGGVQYENENIEIVEMAKHEIPSTDFIDGKTIFALNILKLF